MIFSGWKRLFCKHAVTRHNMRPQNKPNYTKHLLSDKIGNTTSDLFLLMWQTKSLKNKERSADVPVCLSGAVAAQQHSTTGSSPQPRGEVMSSLVADRWRAPPLWLPGSAKHKYGLLLWPLQDNLTAPRFILKTWWRGGWMWAWADCNWWLALDKEEITCDFAPDLPFSRQPAWGFKNNNKYYNCAYLNSVFWKILLHESSSAETLEIKEKKTPLFSMTSSKVIKKFEANVELLRTLRQGWNGPRLKMSNYEAPLDHLMNSSNWCLWPLAAYLNTNKGN